MPNFARPRTLLAVIAALLGVALLGAGAPPPAVAQLAKTPPRVLVLGGGDPAADAAVVAALAERQLDVESGPATLQFSGDRQSLRSYDVVVALLSNATPQSRLTPQGVEALQRFVERGGGLVTAEPLALTGQLNALLPAISCNSNAAPSTTLTRVTPNATLDAGVPVTFTLALSPGTIRESCLNPKDEAAVLYSSSNGGGRRGAAALASWNVGQGRVVSFSTSLGAVELQNAAYKALFQNTVAWMASTRDTTPPTIKSFTVTGAGGLVGQQIQIALTASDSGGSGLGSFYIREYGYSGDPADGWDQEGASAGWQPYTQPGASVTWNLSAKPGVRYIQAFVADRAGNIARAGAEAIVNYAPPQAALAQDETHIYRISPGAGVLTTVRMDALSGDPDLYVFLGPQLIYKAETAATPEQAAFTAQAGTYQLEVTGATAGGYRLTLSTGAAPLQLPGEWSGISRRPRISPTTIFPPEPPDDPSALPTAPVDPTAAAVPQPIFLPLLR